MPENIYNELDKDGILWWINNEQQRALKRVPENFYNELYNDGILWWIKEWATKGAENSAWKLL